MGTLVVAPFTLHLMRSAAIHLSFALSLLAALPAVAQTPAIDRLQIELQTAVCQNDWPQAIDRVNQLIGSEELLPENRERLVRYRLQLQSWRASGARFANLPNCGAANFTPATAPGGGEAIAPQTTIAPAIDSLSPPALVAPPQPIPLVALSPTVNLDLSGGSATQMGTVSSGQQVYRIEARAGDRLTIDVSVTRVMAGTPFTDDDSQLFLFDSAGRLVAQNDDNDRSFQSRISNFTVPYSGTYFVVVTTFNNDPVLNPSGIVTRWEGDGGSNIEYRLSVTTAPSA
ncbi:MAG: hypothetical protein F6K28_25780 [Microcoleus sp. SIO2G3]|nr:hypothetical protein [Microcoleus sp. SIO2G3]